MELKSRQTARWYPKVFGSNFSNLSVNRLMREDGNEKPTFEKVNTDFTIRVAERI